MINTDCKVPKGTPKDKHGKFGVEFPIQKGYMYELYRENILCIVKPQLCENDPDGKFRKLYCMPGDLLMNLTDNYATFFAIRFIEEDE